jgi:hypothetical protein
MAEDNEEKRPEFNANWSKTFKWIRYDEEENAIFCKLCEKFQPRTTIFSRKCGYNGAGEKCFRRDRLTQHTQTDSHKSAEESYRNGQLTLHQSLEAARRESKRKADEMLAQSRSELMRDYWHPHAILCSYFLAKNRLPYNLMEELCKLVQSCAEGFADGKKFNIGDGQSGSYTNDTSAKDIAKLSPKMSKKIL